ncbi:uncharacterized protein IUM83_04934 [Phytophthora cinnamomi]|uniref:uncharacterized protein n=1 Tax=Phytophthora cinnamomi TaxID=4785 RepID=UPI003559DD94|nr:hypothetical protein IUM83_04934 [Phytophthora cinnamomi]
MARRNVLHGASAWEREEKANQQRDYAAQLQQQVLQKQAKQEQEKARKQQEQREELEMLERQQAAANRNHHPQPEQGMHHLTSPSKTISAGVSVAATEPVQDIPAFSPASYSGGSESCVSTFSSSPSIFETLLREPGIGARSIAFYEDLATLHQLTAELDSVAKQRHGTGQNSYNKPDFVHPEEISPPPAFSSTSLRSPVKLSPDKAPHEDNQVENAAVSQKKMKYVQRSA